MVNEDEIKEEYFFARHMIQLQNPRVISLRVKNINNRDSNKQCKVDMSLKRTITLIDAVQASGEVLIHINIPTVLSVDLSYGGIFVAEEELNDFKHLVELQVVPQLWPYIRSIVTDISLMCGLAPLVLPTLDVVRAINANRKTDAKADE